MHAEEIQIDREDIVLLLLEANERILGRDYLNGITRLEKLLFLLDRETDFEGIGEFYQFEPHNFGPFSKEVYEAVEFLSACDLVDVREKTYSSVYTNSDEAKLLSEISEGPVSFELGQTDVEVTEKQFALTDDGRKVARIIRDAVRKKRKDDVEQLDAITRRFGSMPLNQLIRYVYRQHPDMTVKSVHPDLLEAPASEVAGSSILDSSRADRCLAWTVSSGVDQPARFVRRSGDMGAPCGLRLRSCRSSGKAEKLHQEYFSNGKVNEVSAAIEARRLIPASGARLRSSALRTGGQTQDT